MSPGSTRGLVSNMSGWRYNLSPSAPIADSRLAAISAAAAASLVGRDPCLSVVREKSGPGRLGTAADPDASLGLAAAVASVAAASNVFE
jgi:hypothetical protein